MPGKRPKRPFALPALLAGCVLLLASALSAPAASAAAAAPHPSAAPPGARARAAAATDVLMDSYDPKTAWWPSSWWNSAEALHALLDYRQRSGDRRYDPVVAHTFEVNRVPFAAGERSTDPVDGDFISRSIDDSAWWALTWIKAYDVTGRRTYLNEAVRIADYVSGFWDTGTCGGGVWWNREKTYKNAVTNGQYVRLTAELHNRLRGDTVWLARARAAWTWYTSSGLINSSGLVNDGLDDDCRNNGQTVWTYNQGMAIGAGVEMWRATGDRHALATARRLADAALRDPSLVRHGVLTESCDTADATCDDNGKQFKGIFIRYVGDLADATHDPRYRSFVRHQAAVIWTHDRDTDNRLGERWSGLDPADHPNVRDWRTQASALEALSAALPPGRHPGSGGRR